MDIRKSPLRDVRGFTGGAKRGEVYQTALLVCGHKVQIRRNAEPNRCRCVQCAPPTPTEAA